MNALELLFKIAQAQLPGGPPMNPPPYQTGGSQAAGSGNPSNAGSPPPATPPKPWMRARVSRRHMHKLSYNQGFITTIAKFAQTSGASASSAPITPSSPPTPTNKTLDASQPALTPKKKPVFSMAAFAKP